jgi:hypothetical protein
MVVGRSRKKKSWLRNKYSRGVHDCEVAENAHKPYQQYHQLHKEGLRRTKGQLGVAIGVGMLRRPKFDMVVVRKKNLQSFDSNTTSLA